MNRRDYTAGAYEKATTTLAHHKRTAGIRRFPDEGRKGMRPARGVRAPGLFTYDYYESLVLGAYRELYARDR